MCRQEYFPDRHGEKTPFTVQPQCHREQKIAKLNARVEAISRKALADHGLQSVPLYIQQVQQPMTHMTAGYPVYQKRSASLVYVYWVMASCLILYGLVKLHPLVAILCFGITFIGYDVYSGILHVVFDHPENIKLPFIGQPCLEFQWHHLVPDDLVRKDFVDVCGDLNVVVGVLILLNVILLDMTSDVAVLIGGLKFGMAYFGQFSHRSAHTHGPQLSKAARLLQTYGFMISTRDHKTHHKAPYDVDFCLIGICNPVIDVMRRVTANNTAWVILFFLWSVLDLVVYIWIVEKLVCYRSN